MTRELGRITAIERLNTSYYGNPRFAITYERDDFVEVKRITSSDIADAYEVENPGYRVGDIVRFDLTRAGRIAMMVSINHGAKSQ